MLPRAIDGLLGSLLPSRVSQSGWAHGFFSFESQFAKLCRFDADKPRRERLMPVEISLPYLAIASAILFFSLVR
jgi:hypothetical protein